MSDELRVKMSQRSSEELRSILLKPESHTPEAVEAAGQELRNRGLDPGTRTQPGATVQDESQPEAESASPVEIDEAKLRRYMQELKDNQNLAMGAIGGLIAAVIGATLWAVITAFTGYQIGWLAIGVGFLVGYGVRISGKGIDTSFGAVGAVLSLLGCLAGNLLAVCILVSREESIPLFALVSRLNPQIVSEIMIATFSPIDLLFYGIAVYEGYKFSFRRITEEELVQLAK